MKQLGLSQDTNKAAEALTVVRELPFVEFIELLEFSHLRFDLPKRGSTATLVGSQEWNRRIQDDAADPGSVYVCTTLDALHHAVLPPEDAVLKIDMPSKSRVRLRTLSRQRVRPASQPCVRVDLQGLIRRVLVPANAPAHLFDLVRHVVMTRLWVEVARVSSARF
ncbi:hypothetical protein LMG26685_02083 [Achromobacter mucicolens]|uniref:hypothetical protein n=1 Tax=Achromobacter mucicolens TaxID=1389922 RepID=UPI0009D4A914|nr:hypothetical protein [Achromobacter mucicolens]OXC91302.1 hypothetical protein BMR85_009250 [Achromobacter sp. KAs 3-5]WBX90276.1 hypothetical protein PE062_06490 [Achromobacter mucicolens]CAB3642630.1 hypothetical protein LMG26685_02083 [Achromobacter mucicolens]